MTKTQEEEKEVKGNSKERRGESQCPLGGISCPSTCVVEGWNVVCTIADKDQV